MKKLYHTFIVYGAEIEAEQKLEKTEGIDIVLMTKDELIIAMKNGELS